MCILANGENNEVARETNHQVSRELKSETNSTMPVEITINQGGSSEKSSSFHFDWISLLVEGLAMLTGFVAVWMKIRKERKLQKNKRSKLKGRFSKI